MLKKFPPLPTTTNPLGLVIKLLTCALLSLTISRELRAIRDYEREKREKAESDK